MPAAREKGRWTDGQMDGWMEGRKEGSKKTKNKQLVETNLKRVLGPG